jgi:alpha-tubulin suppressor-like RCC1 family protein
MSKRHAAWSRSGRRYTLIGLFILLFLLLVLVWASVAPAAGVPSLAPRQQATFSFGGSHILAIKTDGSLWAFGMNDAGELGVGSTTMKMDFVRVGTDTDWTTVAAGVEHSLALKFDGSLWAWGSNEYGQLGDGTNLFGLMPKRIGMANDWASVYAGGEQSWAIKMDGSLWGWGAGEEGQIGDGGSQDRLSPTRIGDGNDWLAVFPGMIHTLALKTDGSLWAWGDNEYGQLGDGTLTDRNVPTRVGSSNKWVAASAGLAHSLGLMADGSLWAWGNNEMSQLGDGSTTDSSTPIRVGAANTWARVSAGAFTSLAINTDGSLWCWGTVDLGTGSTRSYPFAFDLDMSWAEVSDSLLMAAGLKADGTLWLWVLPALPGATSYDTTPTKFLSDVRLPGSAPQGVTTTTTASSTTTTTISAPTTSTTSTTVPGTPTFSDVPATHPYFAAVSAMAAMGAVSGYQDGTFGPDKPVLRKHFAKMIVGAMGITVTEADWSDANPPFVDCGPDDPASLYPHDYIAAAKAHNLTAGKTANTFVPDAEITRAQMVTMVVRAAQNSGVGLKAVGADYNGPFKTFDDPNHGGNVRLADYNGLLAGVVTGFNPSAWITGNATRGEVAQVLWNLVQAMRAK